MNGSNTGLSSMRLGYLLFVLVFLFSVFSHSVVRFRQQNLVKFRQHNYLVRFRQQNYLVRFRQHNYLVRFRQHNYLVRFNQKALKAIFSHGDTVHPSSSSW